MKISVIIPTFDRADFLAGCLNSVLSQAHTASEIIVVDDGSTDSTSKLLQTYHKNHPQIKPVFLKHNHGVSRARNEGIAVAQNDWIAFLDSDDIWHKDKLKHQITFHNQNPHYLISQCQEIWIKEGVIMPQPKWAHKQSGDMFLASLKHCLISTSSVLISKKIFKDIGLFDESLIACEDYDLWLRITSQYTVGLIEKQLISKIAGHSNQLSTIWGLDRFRVVALQKHLGGKYHNEVKTILLKKYQILQQGAIKRNNQTLAQMCEKALTQLLQ